MSTEHVGSGVHMYLFGTWFGWSRLLKEKLTRFYKKKVQMFRIFIGQQLSITNNMSQKLCT